MPGRWMTGMSQSDWLQERGTVLWLASTATHAEYGSWHFPCEIDTATLPATIFVPQADEDHP